MELRAFSEVETIFPFVALSACVGVLSAAEPAWTAEPGPWGDLQVRTSCLEPPDNILAVVAKPTPVTRRTFEQTTAKDVRGILEKSRVPTAVVAVSLGRPS